MIILYKDPQCKSVVVNIKQEEVSGTASESVIDPYTHTVDELHKKIKELELCVESQKKQIKAYANCEGNVD